MWQAAAEALGRQPGDMTEHTDGQLHTWRHAFAREMHWAPEHKGDELALVRGEIRRAQIDADRARRNARAADTPDARQRLEALADVHATWERDRPGPGRTARPGPSRIRRLGNRHRPHPRPRRRRRRRTAPPPPRHPPGTPPRPHLTRTSPRPARGRTSAVRRGRAHPGHRRRNRRHSGTAPGAPGTGPGRRSHVARRPNRADRRQPAGPRRSRGPRLPGHRRRTL